MVGRAATATAGAGALRIAAITPGLTYISARLRDPTDASQYRTVLVRSVPRLITSAGP